MKVVLSNARGDMRTVSSLQQIRMRKFDLFCGSTHQHAPYGTQQD